MAKLYLGALGAEAAGGSFDPASPYPGLRHFEERDAALFFGRRRLVEELLTQLEFQPMVLLLGSSGCGKSSVVRAGVIPRWREKYPDGKVILTRPGTNPFESLARAVDQFPEAVAAAVRQPGPKVFRQLLPAAPSTSPSSSGGAKEQPPRILLAIDAFEELFTCQPAKDLELQGNFLDSLVDLVRMHDSGIQLLLTLRDDCIAHLRNHDDFCRVADNSLQRITSLRGDGLRECIEAPARARGVRFEEGLIEEVQRQAEAREGMLPLLQDALATWWSEEQLADRLLRRATLERLGGVGGALPGRLTRWFEALPAADQNSVRQTLLRLVDFSAAPEEWPPSLCSAPRSALTAASSDALLKALFTQRILAHRDVASEADPHIELSHESILHSWPVFKEWIEDVRAAATVRRQIQEDALRWSTSAGREKRDLRWRGYRLEQAIERQQQGDFSCLGGLNPLETRFLEACSRARAFRSVRDRALGVAAGLVALVSVGAALLATNRFRDATNQKHAAEVKAGLGWLARAENAEGSTDAGFYAAFATGFCGAGREAASQAEPRPGPLSSFLAARKRDPYPRCLTLQDSPARKIEADRRMASAPKPFVWSSPFTGADGPVHTVAFSLNGLLATAGDDGRVRLWAVATGALERTLDSSTSPVLDLDFSPAGAFLVSGHADGSAILWDTATGQKAASFQGHTGSVQAVAFSPDGTQVASGGDDGSVKIWNVETAGETLTFAGHSGPVLCLSFGPGGTLLASGGSDQFVRVWDVARGEEVNILSGHLNAVHSLAFNPSGRQLASAGRDQTVILWDLESHKPLYNLPSTGASAKALAFSPDGAHLALAGEDGLLRLCTLGQERAVSTFPGHSGAIRSLAFSPDGKLIVTGSDDRTAKLWAVRDAWKSTALPRAQADSASGSPADAVPTESFDWFRYVSQGWVRFDEHRSALVWEQLPQGFPFASQNLPPHSWAGVLRRAEGEEKTRHLLALALEARNWDAASLLRKELPADAQLPSSPAAASAAVALRMLVQDDLEAGRTALAEWRMQQGDALFRQEREWAALRGEYLEKSGNPGAALAFYRELDHLAGWQAVARLSPDGKEAVEAWRRVLEADPRLTPGLYLAAGKRAAEAGDAPFLRKFFTEGIQRFPSDRFLKTEFARRLVALSALDEALPLFESMAEGEGNAIQNLVPVLKETECLDPVLRLLAEKAAALKASGPEAAALDCLQRLASLYEAAGRTDDAILTLKDRISYLQGLSGDHDLSGALNGLSEALMNAGRRDEALTVMRVRVDLLKTQPPAEPLFAALRELQTSLESAGLSGEAIEVLQERITVLKPVPGAAVSDLLAELAAALRKAARDEEAFSVMEERVAALQAEGKDPVPAIRDWAAALHSAGKGAEAWAVHRKIAALPQANASLLSEVAYWGAIHGHAKDAAALFEEAAAQARDDTERALVGRRRGWAFLQAGAPEEAFLAFGMAKAQLESSPETAKLIDSKLQSGLAAAFWLTDRKGAALDEYEALWQHQKDDERWEDAEYVRQLDLPQAGRDALLGLHAIWHERMHLARAVKR